jgi:hypothetical protein
VGAGDDAAAGTSDGDNHPKNKFTLLSLWDKFPKFTLGFVIASIILTVTLIYIPDECARQATQGQHFEPPSTRIIDWDRSVLTGGRATMGATGTAHFGTVGNQPFKCPIQGAEWHGVIQLIVVQPQPSKGREGPQEQGNGSGQEIVVQRQNEKVGHGRQ